MYGRRMTTAGAGADLACLAVLRHCTCFSKLTQIHATILKFGLHNNGVILTKFTAVSSDLGAIDYACSFLFSPNSDLHCHDTFLFNTVIKAYADTPHLKRTGVCYYRKMLRHGGGGADPNNYTYPFVFKACAGIGDLKLGQSVHASAMKLGFHFHAHVANSMIHTYCSCEGGIGYARKVFDEMPELNVVSWSTMIGGYVKSSMSSDAIKLFRSFQIHGERPDEATMAMVLSACADLGALELGRWVEAYMVRENLPMESEIVYNAMIDMFAKCGDVDKALKLFRKMPPGKRTVVAWTCAISGMALHGRGLEAVSLFEEMKGAGVVPDDVVFIGLLSACSHSGLVKEGWRYFDSMVTEHGIEPRVEHYGCMVDMLSRAGFVEEALKFIDKMPMAPSPVIWRSLVSACRSRGQLALGERVSKNLIVQDPMEESNYVLLSSVYAKSQDWAKKTRAREAMGKKRVQKIPGSTMIELAGDIHEFVAGDKCHAEYPKIYEMADEMETKIRAAGYVASASEVMLDIDREDKEGALHRHSERLAMAFALLKTPPGSTIRLMKNLRVCDDCHSATKIISVVYRREILVRDRSRFHHFKNGLCSCKDFW
ncbi:pentatricopeptide repeat-containing protein At4g21065-like [Andrographis paniculata]|uniref:pentatricopeptide repeat-containing protein At4g21065-like n=1 Tax=Andrographis paniculata TaxID=175694 RepID=UPI0021E88359|nr:pentatricopeptide repeat-containing protein At4g21065-like [Andrographis paniculata]